MVKLNRVEAALFMPSESNADIQNNVITKPV